MSTTIELTEQEIAELKEVTAQSDLPAAIRTALSEYIRYVQRMRLKELSGKVEMLDNWAELEAAELKAADIKHGADSD